MFQDFVIVNGELTQQLHLPRLNGIIPPDRPVEGNNLMPKELSQLVADMQRRNQAIIASADSAAKSFEDALVLVERIQIKARQRSEARTAKGRLLKTQVETCHQ